MRVHLTGIDRWIANVRLGAVVFAVIQVTLSHGYPPGYQLYAAAATATLGVVALALWFATRRERGTRFGALALAFDVAIVSAFVLIYHFEAGTPTRQLLLLPLVEGAVRFGLWGAVVVAVAETPVAAVFEHLRSARFHTEYRIDFVTFQLGVALVMGAIVGWLVNRLRAETELSRTRAREAEELRDALGRRVDVLEAANRCARALGASLDVDEALNGFIREVRGLVPFDRMAVVLVEGDRLEVLATAGAGSDDVFPPGTMRPVRGSIFEAVSTGQTVYRRDMRDTRHPEEVEFLALGLRSRLLAPLLVGSHAIGLVSFVRREPDAFTTEEIELVSLIGRLAATAVQNIRAFEAERRTVDELRRLSALRADFVSLVSHELRSPMAAVIGSARTLQQRWRELAPEQRESFLALIADETTRLASLIGDVLDTSRIEAGTFSYTFSDVDVARLVEETVATAQVGQDEVRLQADVPTSLPVVRGDRERLRQVVSNLIENAVKYSTAGDEVIVAASASNGRVLVEVKDRGAGIPHEQQRLIFEKFGRAKGGDAKPGTGLGLFIARSIAEAHGGTLDVYSVPGQGSTFTLALPVETPTTGRAAG